MFQPRTTPQTQPFDYEAFINAYLNGTDDGEYSGFQMNARNHELSLPSIDSIEKGTGIDLQLDQTHADIADDHEAFTAEWATELIVADYFPNGEATVINTLQDDLHEIFPNEKMWPHLDALAETAARAYFNEFKEAVYTQADLYASDHAN